MSQAPSSDRFVFGLVPTETALDAGLNTFLRWLGDRAGVRIIRRQVPSYDALAAQMSSAAIDVAWLPPLVFVGLERRGVAAPLVTTQRQGKTLAVLIVRDDSPIRTLADLRGARAAWVDPLSATGYVLAQLHLATHGVDPRSLFAHEHFYGSHADAVRAVLEQSAEVASTFAGLTAEGAIVRSGWSDLHGERVRILADVGTAPPDLVAVRADISQSAREPLARAFVQAYDDELMRPIIKRVFGVEAFSTEGFASYEDLRRTIDAASSTGALDATTPYSRTMPPGPPD